MRKTLILFYLQLLLIKNKKQSWNNVLVAGTWSRQQGVSALRPPFVQIYTKNTHNNKWIKRYLHTDVNICNTLFFMSTLADPSSWPLAPQHEASQRNTYSFFTQCNQHTCSTHDTKDAAQVQTCTPQPPWGVELWMKVEEEGGGQGWWLFTAAWEHRRLGVVVLRRMQTLWTHDEPSTCPGMRTVWMQRVWFSSHQLITKSFSQVIWTVSLGEMFRLSSC